MFAWDFEITFAYRMSIVLVFFVLFFLVAPLFRLRYCDPDCRGLCGAWCVVRGDCFLGGTVQQGNSSLKLGAAR